MAGVAANEVMCRRVVISRHRLISRAANEGLERFHNHRGDHLLVLPHLKIFERTMLNLCLNIVIKREIGKLVRKDNNQ